MTILRPRVRFPMVALSFLIDSAGGSLVQTSSSARFNSFHICQPSPAPTLTTWLDFDDHNIEKLLKLRPSLVLVCFFFELNSTSTCHIWNCETPYSGPAKSSFCSHLTLKSFIHGTEKSSGHLFWFSTCGKWWEFSTVRKFKKEKGDRFQGNF